ncbi:MAG: gfo/Idh/MocA family oxidoreductase [Verrucomicrobiae bacterium]|nr:gfo/Idh/MocA family oxidoreductase [Verrucomicrobiae bacterium]
MSETSPTPQSILTPTRRDILKTGGQLAAASALAGISLPHVHAQGNDSLSISLVGCGGRGTGAVKNALSVSGSLGPIKLHAMADVFEDKLNNSYQTLLKDPQVGDKVDVSPDRQFIGFDGYRHAMDALKPGDIVILTTPCAFRWPMFEYAIEKGLNVFMEKPLCPDGHSARKLLELNQKAKAKNLKVGVGLMCRHCKSRNELKKRIDDGAIGDIHLLRSYRMQGRIGSCFSAKNDTGKSELEYQIRNFHSFIWLSGGAFSDFFIHGIDEMCMIKNAWPVKAHAVGGRHYKTIELNGQQVEAIDQNFDSYGVEYTFEDGAKAMYYGRNMAGCKQEFAAYAHGTKGSAVISTSSHVPARSRIYSDQNIDMNWRGKPDNLVWAFPTGPRGESLEGNPYDIEWEVMIDAIRNGKEHNEVDRGVAASVVTSMGRMAAHTGQEITYDQMLNSEHVMAPGVENLTMESESPLKPDENGRYPIPEPGIKKDREY